jgi:hypothetical protein
MSDSESSMSESLSKGSNNTDDTDDTDDTKPKTYASTAPPKLV